MASSSVSYDLHAKLHVYRRNGVQEYIVWRVLEREIDWFVLRGGQYEPLSGDAQGLIRSEIFPGLWLDPAALVRGDLTNTLAVAAAIGLSAASRVRESRMGAATLDTTAPATTPTANHFPIAANPSVLAGTT